MLCPRCNASNNPTNQFCISCGASLNTTVYKIPQQSKSPVDELRQLRQLMTRIDERLTELEKDIKKLAAYEEKVETPTTEKTSVTYEKPPEPPKPLYVPVAETRKPDQPKEIISKHEAIKVPEVKQRETPPVRETIKPPTKVKIKKPPGEWEQILGGNWLARIGVFALLIGIAFFLKYAFDKDWISPTIRVIMGGALGLILLGGGFLWRKKYPIMTQVIPGRRTTPLV